MKIDWYVGDYEPIDVIDSNLTNSRYYEVKIGEVNIIMFKEQFEYLIQKIKEVYPSETL